MRVIANWLTDESLAEYRGLIKNGAGVGGPRSERVQICTLLMTCATPQTAPQFSRRAAGSLLAARRSTTCTLRHLRSREDARTVKVAWDERDFDRARNWSRMPLLDKFSLVGTPEKNAAGSSGSSTTRCTDRVSAAAARADGGGPPQRFAARITLGTGFWNVAAGRPVTLDAAAHSWITIS